MRSFKILSALLIALPCFGDSPYRMHYVSIGPMVHLNFGPGGMVPSFALEASYWTFHRDTTEYGDSHPRFPGWGGDLGVEWERGKLRLYGEPEVGIAFAGVGAGPVLELGLREGVRPVTFGLQESVWANWVVGADLRLRQMQSGFFVSPGAYGKLPVPAAGP